MSEIRRVPFLIIGGGIGGLATALALSRQGYAVHLIEKAPQFGEIGAGIQIAPNASRVLDHLGVLNEIRKYAVYPHRLVLMDALSSELITALDLGKAFLDAYTYPYLVMHRSDLLTILLDACRASDLITLETSKNVTSIEDLGNGARVECSDGSIYVCNALVGADGLHSVTRKLVIDNREPICAEFVAYRGAIPMEKVVKTEGIDNMVFWTGPNMHFVQYPVRRGELYNQVAVFKSPHYPADSDDRGTPEELDKHFERTCQHVRDGLKLIQRNRHWPMYDRPSDTNWMRNHITLIGDAAHPMLQYIAQGACQALEDAGYLAKMYALYDGDARQAFLAYQEERLPRTARVQHTARLFGDICHIDGIGIALRNTLLAQRAFDDFTHIDWLYGYATV